MQNYPQPIALTLELYENETQPFRKAHRLIDLAETVIKYYTVVTLCNYIESEKIHDDIKAVLAAGLKTPSLGIWAFFTENIHPHIQEKNAVWKDFPTFFQNTLKKVTAPIIEFRNSYAHGSTPSDQDCLDDCKKIFPLVETILNTKYITEYELVVFRKVLTDKIIFDVCMGLKEERVEAERLSSESLTENSLFIKGAGDQFLSLHPLLVLKPNLPKVISEEDFNHVIVPNLTKQQIQNVLSIYKKQGSSYNLKDTRDADKSRLVGEQFQKIGFSKEKYFYYNDLSATLSSRDKNKDCTK